MSRKERAQSSLWRPLRAVGAATFSELAVALLPSVSRAEPASRIPAVQLLEEHPRAGLALVDTRPASSFDLLRIPRSLNIPLFAVRTKAFLRDRSVVLLNEGFELAAL